MSKHITVEAKTFSTPFFFKQGRQKAVVRWLTALVIPIDDLIRKQGWTHDNLLEQHAPNRLQAARHSARHNASWCRERVGTRKISCFVCLEARQHAC